MKLFYTNAQAKAEIGRLEELLTTSGGDAITLNARITELSAELATCNESLATMTTERDDAAAAFTLAESSLITTAAELTAATAKLATFDADVELAAQAKFAGLGGPPVSEFKSDDNGGKGISGLSGFSRVSAAFAAQKK